MCVLIAIDMTRIIPIHKNRPNPLTFPCLCVFYYVLLLFYPVTLTVIMIYTAVKACVIRPSIGSVLKVLYIDIPMNDSGCGTYFDRI